MTITWENVMSQREGNLCETLVLDEWGYIQNKRETNLDNSGSSGPGSSGNSPAPFTLLIGVTQDSVDRKRAFNLGIDGGRPYDAMLDWGDGTPPVHVTIDNASEWGTARHVYTAVGEYQLTITGNWPWLTPSRDSDSMDRHILEILNWGEGVTTFENMTGAFEFCSRLRGISAKDTLRGVLNMHWTFSECQAVETLDLSSIDFSTVTDLSGLVGGITNLRAVNLSTIDTSRVINLSSIFNGCRNLVSPDVSGFNTSLCEDMGFMFAGMEKVGTLNVSNFDTSKCTNLNSMFEGVHVTVLDLSGFDTHSCSNFGAMFGNSNIGSIIGIEKFSIQSIDAYAFGGFLENTGLPQAQYDALLIAWAAQNPIPGVTADFGSSKYTQGGVAEAARTALKWNITDGGPVT